MYEVRTKKEVVYGTDSIGAELKGFLKMKVAEIFLNIQTQSMSAKVLIADLNGNIVKTGVVPYKEATFMGLFGDQKVSELYFGADQNLIASIDAMNTQLTQAGKADKLVFFGLFAEDMELFEIVEEDANKTA